MKFRNVIFGALAGAGLLTGAMAFAGPGFGGGPGGHGGLAGIERHAEELGLDDAQLTQIREIAEANRESMKEARTELREAQGELEALMSADKPNQKAIFAQIDTIGDLRTELQKERVSVMLQIKAVLTPDQVEALKALRAERREEMGERGRGHRGGPPGGQRGPGGFPGGL